VVGSSLTQLSFRPLAFGTVHHCKLAFPNRLENFIIVHHVSDLRSQTSTFTSHPSLLMTVSSTDYTVLGPWLDEKQRHEGDHPCVNHLAVNISVTVEKSCHHLTLVC